MKTNKITQALTTFALFGMALPAAAADADDQTGWYLGLGGGIARATIAEQQIIDDLFLAGFQTTDFDSDEQDFGYKIFAGYQVNQNFAVESGFFHPGEFSYTASTLPAGSRSGSLDFKGWNLDLVGLLPFTKRSSLFARVGVHMSEATVNYAGTGAVTVLTPYARDSGMNYKVGLGYQYQVDKQVSLRLEAERYRLDDAVGHSSDIDLYTLNVIYRFGQAAVAAVVPSKAPERPVAAAEQYCSALAMQFEIGNESIERVNHEHLLVLATFLSKYPNTKARIEGHTDNVGNDADNLRLSQQRAQSVVDYLAREHDIARNRLTAKGYGETRPLANNATDTGKRANRRINAVIDCATDMAGLNPLPARTTLAMELEFDTQASKVDRKYHEQLKNIARYLRDNPDLIVTMEGHTDNANPDTAMATSQQRARSVADYLVSNFGVERSRLNVEGFGSTRRDTYNITAANRQHNRRVNIILGYRK